MSLHEVHIALGAQAPEIPQARGVIYSKGRFESQAVKPRTAVRTDFTDTRFNGALRASDIAGKAIGHHVRSGRIRRGY
ncbi:MAG: hypothetical protein UT39_C0008G0039 [Candidatus Woesebacteria bacterium GW2011_GWA1_39_21]|uniref:Uncharacterized protein n=1 Tax=Candidatus Woesebacteria bacterium GW2011_GWA1_39_21 TaxID=1618550 RepID=A0A0G0NF06_9BACT|nr:MAG: hypothetical protein UT39_C0008G0039 [Candidatus Woesebacteria bacterium GW2011_GWA1_39_21]